MPTGPAARVADPVSHPLPPVLTGGTGSPNVMIGGKPAWRGIPAAAAAALDTAKKAADDAIKVAENASKAASATAMGAMISSLGGASDIHNCNVPLPAPPHGPGVVVDGSKTVMINNLPACRAGDTITEAVGPPNKIAVGCPSVIIGG